MTLLRRTYNLQHQVGPPFLPDQYPASKDGKKSIAQYLCNLAIHLMEQKPLSSSLQWAADIFKKGIWSFPFIFVCPNATCTPDTLEFQASTSIFCRLWRGFAGTHQQISLKCSSRSTHVAQCSWAMMNIQVILKSALAEAIFNLGQLRGNTNFCSRSQKKAVTSL